MNAASPVWQKAGNIHWKNTKRKGDIMKKVSAFGLILAMVLGLATGCGDSDASTPATGSDNSGETVYTLKVSHTQNADTPICQGIYEFERIVEEKSNGRMQIEVYPSGSLGDTQELVTQCLSGSNIGFMTDAGRFTDFVPEIGILNAPYVINNYEEGLAAVQSEYFQGLSKQLEDEGYKCLSFNWYEGARHILTNTPVNNLADLAGVKLRTGSTKEWVGTLEAFGAVPTALAQSDVYNGIQNKVVDGADQQIITVYSMQLYEVAPYYILTNQYQLMLALCVNTNWFYSLPEDLQELLVDASIEAGEYSSKITNEITGSQMDEMVSSKGLVVTELSDAEMQEWIDAAEAFYDANPEYKEWRASLFEAIGK